MIRQRPVIGLVGQICAGKSAVAQAFQQRGAKVYEADRAVHDLYGREDVKEAIRERFGGDVFDENGGIDRKRLGAIVFKDARKLKALTEEVIFPRTRVTVRAMAEAFRADTEHAALLLDAPTLLEAGNEKVCDKLLFVSAPRARRERWASEQRGWEAAELTRREQHLMDENEKRSRCDAIIENEGTLEDLDRRVGAVWKLWVEPINPTASNGCTSQKAGK